MLAAAVPELKESFNSGFVIPFGDTGFGITQYMLYAILVWIIVFAVVMLVGKRLTLVPNNKFVNMVEYGYISRFWPRCSSSSSSPTSSG